MEAMDKDYCESRCIKKKCNKTLGNDKNAITVNIYEIFSML